MRDISLGRMLLARDDSTGGDNSAPGVRSATKEDDDVIGFIRECSGELGTEFVSCRGRNTQKSFIQVGWLPLTEYPNPPKT